MEGFPRAAMSTFVARDRGGDYQTEGVSFLQDNAVATTALAVLTAAPQAVANPGGLLEAGDPGHSIRTLTAASERRRLKVMTTEAGRHTVEAALATDAAPLEGYYLPWDTNRSYHMQLDANADFFFTAPMNGCAVFVTGTDKRPWVYHTNYWLDPEAHPDASTRHERRAAFYERFEALVVGANRTTALTPDIYQRPNGVSTTNTSVFGFRSIVSGKWTFAYHVLFGPNQPYANTNLNVWVRYAQQPYLMTGPLWPALHLPIWRTLLGHYLLG